MGRKPGGRLRAVSGLVCVLALAGCGAEGTSGGGGTNNGSNNGGNNGGNNGPNNGSTNNANTTNNGSNNGSINTNNGVNNEASSVDLGPGASLHGARPFPADNPWNTPIDGAPVDANSGAILASIGLDGCLHPDFGTEWEGAPIGIPYVVVSGAQARVPVTFNYDDESDPGPYPIPPDAPIEGGPDSDGDRHVLVIDRDSWTLYETWSSYPQSDGSWEAGSGAIFELDSNALRPTYWTSADAAGLPVFPGLVRYDEAVELGAIRHALRFTVSRSRRAFLPPATHWASSATDADLPPMGMRVRLKADFDLSGYSAPVRVILQALKTYGMLMADNGSNWYLSGAPDPRWDDDVLRELRGVCGADFEVVEMQGLVTE